MSNIASKFLEAMGIVADKAVSGVSADETIYAQIVSIDTKQTNTYKLAYENSYITAIGNEQYNIGDVVEVKIPNGDFSTDKMIVGKWTGITTKQDFIAYEEEYKDRADLGISASVQISGDGEEDLRGLIPASALSTINLYRAFQLSGDFNYRFAPEDDGTLQFSNDLLNLDYGVELVCKDKESNQHTYTLGINDFAGNPYSSYDSNISQTRLFALADGVELAEITAFRVFVKESSLLENNQSSYFNMTNFTVTAMGNLPVVQDVGTYVLNLSRTADTVLVDKDKEPIDTDLGVSIEIYVLKGSTKISVNNTNLTVSHNGENIEGLTFDNGVGTFTLADYPSDWEDNEHFLFEFKYKNEVVSRGTFTVARLQNGFSPYQIVLSNDYDTVPGQSDGTVTTEAFSGAFTEVQVYYGNELVTDKLKPEDNDTTCLRIESAENLSSTGEDPDYKITWDEENNKAIITLLKWKDKNISSYTFKCYYYVDNKIVASKNFIIKKINIGLVDFSLYCSPLVINKTDKTGTVDIAIRAYKYESYDKEVMPLEKGSSPSKKFACRIQYQIDDGEWELYYPDLSSGNLSAYTLSLTEAQWKSAKELTVKLEIGYPNANNLEWLLWDSEVINFIEDGETPVLEIKDGKWYINNEPTNIPATGEEGITPHIGENGNWWLGDKDTGVKAEGPAGQDGESIKYIFYRSETAVNFDTPPSGVGGNWTDSPQGITDTYKYEYVSSSTEKDIDDNWINFSNPVIWSKWGEKGQDGDGVYYEYYVLDKEDPSQLPDYETNPDKWSDDPIGVSKEKPYEYVIQIKTGQNASISEPTLWAKWSKDGESGKNGDTPYIQGGYWYINGINLWVKAEGSDGADGDTPYIGENGTWWIGDTDTGIQAEGKNGSDATVTYENMWQAFKDENSGDGIHHFIDDAGQKRIGINAALIRTGALCVGNNPEMPSNNPFYASLTQKEVYIGGWLAEPGYLGTNDATEETAPSIFLSAEGISDQFIGNYSNLNLVFKAGDNFGVTDTGVLYANGAQISGHINARTGSFGYGSLKIDSLGGLTSTKDYTIDNGDSPIQHQTTFKLNTENMGTDNPVLSFYDETNEDSTFEDRYIFQVTGKGHLYAEKATLKEGSNIGGLIVYQDNDGKGLKLETDTNSSLNLGIINNAPSMVIKNNQGYINLSSGSIALRNTADNYNLYADELVRRKLPIHINTKDKNGNEVICYLYFTQDRTVKWGTLNDASNGAIPDILPGSSAETWDPSVAGATEDIE